MTMSYHHIEFDDDLMARDPFAPAPGYQDIPDFIHLLGQLTDVELAQAYDDSMEGSTMIPHYLIHAEKDYRGLSYEDLDALLAHQYS